MHGEEENFSGQRLSKDHSYRTAELVDSWGQKAKYIYQTTPTSPHVVQEGFKKNYPRSAKNKLQHIQLSDTTGTSNGFYGQMKLKESFLAANSPYGFSTNRDKMYPSPRLNLLLDL